MSRKYQRTLASQRQQQGKDRRRLEKKAAEGERRVARLTLAIADGGKSFAEIRVVLSAQVAERDACLRALADLEAESTLVVMPDLAERYRRSIWDLAKALSGDAVEQAREAYAASSMPSSRRRPPRAAAWPSRCVGDWRRWWVSQTTTAPRGALADVC
jgi:hypothetical protein